MTFTYPNLLGLRFDASLASYYDSAYRSWEKSSLFSQQLCREVFILQQHLTLERREERALKRRMEEARTALEAGLLAGMDELEEAQQQREDSLEKTRQRRRDEAAAAVVGASSTATAADHAADDHSGVEELDDEGSTRHGGSR